MTERAVLASERVPDAIHRRVVEIAAEIFQIDIDPAIADLGWRELPTWDSFNQLRLVLEIEQAFDLSLTDDELLNLHSMRDLETLLISRCAAI